MIEGKKIETISIIDSKELDKLYDRDQRFVFLIETTYINGDMENYLWRCIVDLTPDNTVHIIFVKFTEDEWEKDKIPKKSNKFEVLHGKMS